MKKENAQGQALRFVLQQMMHDNKISASAWSLKAGKSRNFVGEYLSGRANDMTLGSIEALANALDLSTSDILARLMDQHSSMERKNSLNKIRRTLGLSMATFADRTGIDIDILSRIEKENAPIPKDIAEQIAEKLSIPLSEIF